MIAGVDEEGHMETLYYVAYYVSLWLPRRWDKTWYSFPEAETKGYE